MAAQNCAQNAPDRAHTVLLRLIRLAIYLSAMLLLGYRMPRLGGSAKRSAARPAQPAPSVPHLPVTPRRKHRFIDRQACLDLLAGINADYAATIPSSAPAQPAAAATITPPRAIALPRAIARRPSAAPHPAALRVPSLAPAPRAAARAHPPPPQKPKNRPTQTHA